MDAVHRHESNTRTPNPSEQTLDVADPEFQAACMALVQDKLVVPGLHDTKVRREENARHEASPRPVPSAAERVEDSASQPDSAEVADLRKVIRRLEAHIEE